VQTRADVEERSGPSGAAEPLERLAGALRRRATSAPGPERAATAASLRRHVEEFLLPRAADIDAPLLVVILGSTGSGKSSLLNALSAAPVSPSGVLRPTTRRPVAVAHPEDLGGRFAAVARSSGLDVRTDAGARRGLILVDAPDFDSVETFNRKSALGLLEVADLVIFMTTATRYADRVPWDVLERLRARGVPLLAVVNRLPPEADDADAVLRDYRQMLERSGVVEQGATGLLELVPVREGALDLDRDALEGASIAPIESALDRLMASRDERRALARRALAGAVSGLPDAVEAIAREVDEEQLAISELRATADAGYSRARHALGEELGRGMFLRAEVLRQWQDFIGAGQVARFLAEGIGRIIATVRAMFEPGPPAPAAEVREAAFADLTALTVQHADTAAQRTATEWSNDRYGARALAADDGLWRASPDLADRMRERLEGWAAGIGEEIRAMGAQRKGWALAASLGVNVIGTSAVLAVFVHTGGLTGAEVGITAATAILNQKLLEAIFGEANVAAFVARARESLGELLDRIFASERDRWAAALGETGDPALADALRRAAADVVRAMPA
jgi:energy-coupling factor transporter ATP-binding protein EcfA2